MNYATLTLLIRRKLSANVSAKLFNVLTLLEAISKLEITRLEAVFDRRMRVKSQDGGQRPLLNDALSVFEMASRYCLNKALQTQGKTLQRRDITRYCLDKTL